MSTLLLFRFSSGMTTSRVGASSIISRRASSCQPSSKSPSSSLVNHGKQRCDARRSSARAANFSSAAVFPAAAVAGMNSESGWSMTNASVAAFLALTTGSLFLSSRFSDPSGTSPLEKLTNFGSGGGGGGGGGSGNSVLLPAGLSEADKENRSDQRLIRKNTPTTSIKFVRRATEWPAKPDWGHTAATRVAPSPEKYEVSARAYKGGRLSMEDEYFVSEDGRFAGVFDGHGGGGVSALLRRKLYPTMSGVLSALKNDNSWDGKSTDGDDNTPSITSLVEALKKAYEEIEREAMTDSCLQYQGSTAVAVVVHESESGSRTLVSANVGDSRAILSRRKEAVDLTRDHKPNDDREKARILSMGEKIEWDHYSKVHRVRNLSLSRAIGDRFAKPAVSAEVEIKRFPVSEESDEFMLLASDGLWDVMTSQDVVDFVHKKLGPEPKAGDVEMNRIRNSRRRNMSRFVAGEALKRGTADNVSVVIVWLR